MSNWKQAYEQWRSYEGLEPQLKKELAALADDEAALEEAFYQELTFGTGGIRGVLGPGTNRLNIYTVRKAINGLAHYLADTSAAYQERGVVVAYDSRYMSKEFALEVAKVLGVHGIKTYVFESLRPTPLLSFAVRHLEAAAGIMITASHNPSEYNGFKVYNDVGGQITIEAANAVIAAVQASVDGLVVPVMAQEQLEAEGLLVWVGAAVDAAYLEALETITKLSEAERQREKSLKIVYSPLHGTGLDLVERGLAQLNFPDVTIVAEQAIPDPEFSTVASPNPEEAQAFKLAIEYGTQNDADLLLATDPDADRLGIAVRQAAGDYTLLSGNQLGVLLLDYLLRHTDKVDLTHARLVKTIVTTTFGRALAAAYGVKTVDTLTGFKYISEKIEEYEQTEETFLFGFEESYGYLIDGFARDKDAVQAVVMTCEMAHYWQEQGKTLLDALEELYETHGFYLEGMSQLTLKGIEGTEQIQQIMTTMRETERTEIAGLAIEAVEDYLTSERTSLINDRTVESIALPTENVMKFLLADESWVCLRPSGTEPKIKCYYGVCTASREESEARLALLKTTLETRMDEIVQGE